MLARPLDPSRRPFNAPANETATVSNPWRAFTDEWGDTFILATNALTVVLTAIILWHVIGKGKSPV